MIPRRALDRLKQALQRQAAVALLGPRQVGKTTLALQVIEDMNSLYLDLEAPNDRAKLADPTLFLRGHQNRLVILDEIHRVPEIFQPLRGLIDEGRRQGQATGRFLILGSASMDLLRQSGETLAGRIAYVDLRPFDVLEVGASNVTGRTLWLRGGFPDSFLAADDEQSFEWREDFIRSYLEREVPMFGPRIPAETLRRLWIMLAHGQGTLLNASRLASSLAVSAPTVGRYVDLLVDLLLVRRLPPFHANVKKRLVKSPKTYVRDSGLVHALLGIQNHDALVSHPVVGASWEGFVIENLLGALSQRGGASFYRTAAGAEIDLVLEIPGGETWAVEIKSGLSTKPSKGFYSACEDVDAKRRLVVYAGDDRYPLPHAVEAIGLSGLAAELLAL